MLGTRFVHVFLNTSHAVVPRWIFPRRSRLLFVDESWIKTLRPRHRLLLKRLRGHAHGPGRTYVLKAILPWLLPGVDRVLVLDFDLLFRSPVMELWHEFDNFGPEHMIGVATESASRTYPSHSFAVNGGVQLMRLDRMRQGNYERMLNNIVSSSGHRIGYLGDQTLYTILAQTHRYAFYPLSCRFNRQLNPNADSYKCDDGCSVIHGNHAVWKMRFRKWTSQDASAWEPELKRAMRPYKWKRYFSSCFTSNVERG